MISIADLLPKLKLLEKWDIFLNENNNYNNWRYICMDVDKEINEFMPEVILYNNITKKKIQIKFITFSRETLENNNILFNENTLDYFYENFKHIDIIVFSNICEFVNINLLYEFKLKFYEKHKINIIVDNINTIDNNLIIENLINFQKTRNNLIDINLRNNLIKDFRLNNILDEDSTFIKNWLINYK